MRRARLAQARDSGGGKEIAHRPSVGGRFHHRVASGGLGIVERQALAVWVPAEHDQVVVKGEPGWVPSVGPGHRHELLDGEGAPLLLGGELGGRRAARGAPL